MDLAREFLLTTSVGAGQTSLRILVYPTSLQIGGAQIIAIDLASATRDLGHEVLILGPPGPLAELAASRGLEVMQGISDRHRPSIRNSRTLGAVIRRRQVDLVHAYSHSPCLEAFLGAYLVRGTPLLASYMGRELIQPFPSSIPLVVGNWSLRREFSQRRIGSVHLLRPPIDTQTNHPSVDGSAFLKTNNLGLERYNLVVVSRLANYMKLEGLERSIEAMARVAESMPARLIIVGGGDMLDHLSMKAGLVNQRFGEQVITLTGPLLDPRAAYASADVVLGMGGSILRGMAFQKPAVVLGERGYSEIVTPASLDRFLRHGFYGLGDGASNSDRLSEQILTLLRDSSLRERLGRFSRNVVCETFSLRSSVRSLERIYLSVVKERPTIRRRLDQGIRLGTTVMSRKLKALQLPFRKRI